MPSQSFANDTERYSFLLTEIVKNKAVCLLKASDGFYAMFEDANEQSYLAVWPSISYASENATDDWEGYTPESMSLGEFFEWLDELKADQIFIGAFPITGLQAMAIEPLEFKKHIKSI